MSKRKKKISAKEFDNKFDNGEDISEFLDIQNATKKVNVDFPLWVVKALDKESARLGVTRQSLIKLWITERLDLLKEKAHHLRVDTHL